MQNFYETVRDGLQFKKFALEELLFVEYTCPISEKEFSFWSQRDYILHVLSGKKTWRTLDGKLVATPGDTVYVKKGGTFIRQFFEEEFCILGFFLTDDFIRSTMSELKGKIPLAPKSGNADFQFMRIPGTSVLSSFFQTMLHHFEGSGSPVNALLELKFKELLISIISQKENLALTSYFLELTDREQLSIPSIMERNYCYNFSLEELAKMCNRSVSSFKRDFKKHYHTTPGKWVQAKRLERAAMLLHDETASITQVAFDCGFEDTSHFSRAFKARHGESPLFYRKRVSGTKN